MGFEVQGWGSGFGVWGTGLGCRLRVWGLGVLLRVRDQTPNPKKGVWVLGLG